MASSGPPTRPRGKGRELLRAALVTILCALALELDACKSRARSVQPAAPIEACVANKLKCWTDSDCGRRCRCDLSNPVSIGGRPIGFCEAAKR
jgi:hypothetical protein